ncbi:MAG: non-canonical purine NTP pyrophosphatase [Gemmatimonadaceae bacterium]
MTTGLRPLLVATRSIGKVRELLPLLAAHGWAAESLASAGIPETVEEEALECFPTFEANALAKARWFAARSGGRVVLADDSGLEVDALGGAPGVRSKRWSERPELTGEALDAANNARLRQALEAVGANAPSARRARYVCAAACVWPGGELVRRGETAGVVLAAPVGTGGFGYDPYIWSSELGATFAQVDQSAKAAVSHRGRAVRAMLAAMAGVVPSIETFLRPPVDR